MQSNMMQSNMRNTISIAITFGLLLIVAPTQAADKQAKSQQVVEYKAPAAGWGTDRSWWDSDRSAGNTRRNCSWVGPGGRATYICR
jgi:hypothetical protein